MIKNRPIVKPIIIFLSLLFCLGCPQTGASAQTANLPEDQIGVLFILDNSGSMANNDPSHLRTTAARLFTALLSEGDAVGAVIFADEACALTPEMITIDSSTTKDELGNLFQPITADGHTDVKAAFELAATILKNSPDLPSETVIVFLTDGEPEPLNPTPTYEEDTLAQALSLGLPVVSIALTPSAATPFLTQLSTVTQGQVRQARSAMDILDTYLQILSDLKNRTIIGEGQTTAPDQVQININPGLMPYLKDIQFVVSKDPQTNVTLLDPQGETIAQDDPRLSFSQAEDDRFTIFSITELNSGTWTLSLTGGGAAQVRAVLNVSLRVRFLRPTAFAEAGAPLLIAVQTIETTQTGETIPMVGTAQFSAQITGPSGLQESLDQFYDDGTHGDILAGDGIYSRTYPNTHQSGIYTLTLTGQKDLVPLQAQTQVSLISFPEMTLEAPTQSVMTLDKGEALPLSVSFTMEGIDSGDVIAKVIPPTGTQENITLTDENGAYTGTFTPQVSGTYELNILVEEGTYQSLPYTHVITSTIEITLLPKIRVNLEESTLDLGWVEQSAMASGTTFNLTIDSTADQPIIVDLALENAGGLTIVEPSSLTIPANQQTTLAVTLQGDASVVTGEINPLLVLTSQEAVKLENTLVALSLTLFIPSISIEKQPPLFWSTPQGIWGWVSKLQFTLHNTSLQTEKVSLEITGSSALQLTSDEITVVPGYQTITLTLEGKGSLWREQSEIGLILTPQREDVTSRPAMPVETVLVNPSVFKRGQKTLLWGLPIFFAALITSKIVLRSLKKRFQKPIVTGTLEYWPQTAPQKAGSVDLTAFNQRELTLGSDIHCDIPLNIPELSSKHLILGVEKDAETNHITLTPIGAVHQGYANLVSTTRLNNETLFEIGNYRFRYLSDSGY